MSKISSHYIFVAGHGTTYDRSSRRGGGEAHDTPHAKTTTSDTAAHTTADTRAETTVQ